MMAVDGSSAGGVSGGEEEGEDVTREQLTSPLCDSQTAVTTSRPHNDTGTSAVEWAAEGSEGRSAVEEKRWCVR